MTQSKHEFHWLKSHLESLDKAQGLANEFLWNISIAKREETWIVYAGDRKLLSSTDRAVVEAFLYGLALAYAVIPEPYYSQLKKDLKDWLDKQM
jgi:hypothetical protein